jgi:hypothetical protein
MAAQLGEKAANAKPLKGFDGSGVLESSRTIAATPIARFIP